MEKGERGGKAGVYLWHTHIPVVYIHAFMVKAGPQQPCLSSTPKRRDNETENRQLELGRSPSTTGRLTPTSTTAVISTKQTYFHRYSTALH